MKTGQELSFIYSLSIWYTQSLGTSIFQKIKKKKTNTQTQSKTPRLLKMLLNCDVASIWYVWYSSTVTEKSHLSTE